MFTSSSQPTTSVPASPRIADRVGDLVATAMTVFILGWYWLPATVEQGSAPHDRLFYLGVLPLLAIVAAWAPWRRLLSDVLILTSLGFIGYLTLSVIWSREPMEFPVLRGGLYGISTAAFLLAVTVLAERRRLVVIRLAVVVAAVSAAAAGVVRLAQGHGYPVDRLNSAVCFEHPNLFAHYLGFASILALGAAFRSSRIWVRWAWLGSAVLLAVGVLLTRGRAATAALVVCIVALTALAAGRRVAAAIGLALAASALASSVIVDGHINAFVLRGDAGRDVIYRSLLGRLGGDLAFGAGLASDDNVVFEKGSEDYEKRMVTRHPHSVIVGTIYYGGVVGLVLLLPVMALAVRRGVAIGRRTGVWEPLLLLVFGLLCLSVDGHRLVSNPHLSSWLLFWLPIGLIASGGAGSIADRDARQIGQPSIDDLARVAPGPALATVLAAVAVLAGWAAHARTAPQPVLVLALIVSTAALFSLLQRVIGDAPAGVAAIVFVAVPVGAGAVGETAGQLTTIALASAGLGLLLDGGTVRSLRTWLGAVLLGAAGIPSPVGALAFAILIAWWVARRRVPAVAAAGIGVVWAAVWLLRPPAIGFDSELIAIDAVLGLSALAVGAFVGIGGAVPSVVGILMATTSRHRWLLAWSAGGAVSAALRADPSGLEIGTLLSLAAPLATAVALGVLWLGYELAQLDRTETSFDAAPLDGRRLTVARVLVAILVVVAVLAPRSTSVSIIDRSAATTAETATATGGGRS